MSFKSDIGSFKSKLESELITFFDARIAELQDIDSAKKAVNILKEFTLRGGKRIRAALMYYSYLCFTDSNPKEILKASMSMELVQSYLLIHDDIIDKDDLRRGGPTVHTQYSKNNTTHFGNSIAIMVGDIASSFANLILTNSNLPPKRKISAISKMNQIIHKVIHGEILDVIQDVKDEGDAKLINDLKTVTYTFEGPLLIGAILAGATKKDLTLLSKFAHPIGQAFQIQDDLLDFFGGKSLGKPLGSDLKEGKKTCLILKAINNASPKDRAFIKKQLGKSKISKSDLNKVKSILISSGAVDYCKQNIADLLKESKEIIKSSKFRSQGKNFLIGAIDYIANRSY